MIRCDESLKLANFVNFEKKEEANLCPKLKKG